MRIYMAILCFWHFYLYRNGGGEFGASIPSFIHGIALLLGINCKYV